MVLLGWQVNFPLQSSHTNDLWGSLAQNSVRWSVFEDQTVEDWLQGIEDGASGKGIRAGRMQQWNREWEQFCEWIVEEFGGSSKK